MGSLKRVIILGSTGSIGVNTIKVIESLQDEFKIVGLSANSNAELLSEQAERLRPEAVALRDERKAKGLKGIKVFTKEDGFIELIRSLRADIVVVALAGSAAIRPILAAIEGKMKIALANKESLVSAGSIIMAEAKRCGADIIPVDSEHSAIFQCIKGEDRSSILRLYLTGTGGPLLNRNEDSFRNLTPEEVLQHPVWKMGKKITVDSATLMNKGLEIIEAHWLFGIAVPDIEVLIHPEAIVHSMVEFRDGSVLAQMAQPDMRLPIQYALTYPDRRSSNLPRLNFGEIKHLNFIKPDLKRFPALNLARQAALSAGTYPCVLSAANEELVSAFLAGKIKFTDIPVMLGELLDRHSSDDNPTLEQIFGAEQWARETVHGLIEKSKVAI